MELKGSLLCIQQPTTDPVLSQTNQSKLALFLVWSIFFPWYVSHSLPISSFIWSSICVPPLMWDQVSPPIQNRIITANEQTKRLWWLCMDHMVAGIYACNVDLLVSVQDVWTANLQTIYYVASFVLWFSLAFLWHDKLTFTKKLV